MGVWVLQKTQHPLFFEKICGKGCVFWLGVVYLQRLSIIQVVIRQRSLKRIFFIFTKKYIAVIVPPCDVCNELTACMVIDSGKGDSRFCF